MHRFFYLSSLCTFLGCVLLTSIVNAQSRGRIPPNLRAPERLDPAEGVRVMTQFRQMRLNGDFLFAVELVHEPHRGDAVTYTGMLSGKYVNGLNTRIDFASTATGEPVLRFLQWNGPEPKTWKWEKTNAQTTLTEMQGEGLHQPLLQGITYTPYDLQMPFMHWSDFAYEGSRRLKGRAVHDFLLYPPEEDGRYAEIGAVRVSIDADFNVAVRAETLDLDGETLRRLEVRSVKKVEEQWIVRRIDLIDMMSRDRTQLRVEAARVGLALPETLFTAEGLSDTLPALELIAL